MGLFDNIFNSGGKQQPKLTPQENFYKEIKAGNKGNVLALMQSGFNVFQLDKEQLTPLHIAAWHNHADLAKLFIAKGADVNAKSNGGGTALHLTGSLEIVKLLIKSGADIHARRQEGDTALHRASTGEIAQYLIDLGLDVNDKNVDGLTPLHRATSIDVMTTLLENGADINAKDKDGRTRIFNACRFGNTEWVKYLLENGADPNAEDKNGTTPLLLACMNDLLATNHNAEIVRQLLIHGAEVNLNKESGNKSIEYAKRGNHNIIIQLLEYALNNQKKNPFQQHTKSPENNYDIATCIDRYGFEKTMDSLIALNNETKKLLKDSGELEMLEERFEFDLFAFAYYLLYLKNIKPSFEQILHSMVINFYSALLNDIAKNDPVLQSALVFLIKDKKQYVEDKLVAFQEEISHIKNNPRYLSKYIFSSFYMYQLMQPHSIKEECKNVLDENIVAFQVALNGTIELLESNSKYIIRYVVL